MLNGIITFCVVMMGVVKKLIQYKGEAKYFKHNS